MTKKDYIALASALQVAGRVTAWEDHDRYVTVIAAQLAADNPKFDEARFRAAATSDVE